MTEERLIQILAELAKSQEETQKSLEKSLAELAESQRKTEKSLRESHRKTEETVQKTSKQLGELGNKFGSFTEGMAFPSMTEVLKKIGMRRISTRVKSSEGGENMECDVLGFANGSLAEVIVVEVKSHLREEHLDSMRKIAKEFFKFFPEHSDKTLRLMLAYVDAPENLINKARKAGYYTARVSDDIFQIDVPPNFQPGAWRAGKAKAKAK